MTGLPSFVLLASVLAALMRSAATQTSQNPTRIVSPVRGLEASLAASSAQGTAIALRVPETECVVVFTRTPSNDVWRGPDSPDKNSPVTVLGLSGVIPQRQDVSVSYAPSHFRSDRWVCFMTGLASDVEHLVRRIQLQISNHRSVYQTDQPIPKIWNRVSRLFAATSFRSEERPFGVQMMLTATDAIYTMDPSGNWNSWNVGASIGRHSGTVQRQLAKRLRKVSEERLDLKSCLDIVLRSWMASCKEEGSSTDPLQDECRVTVVWREQHNTRIGVLQTTTLYSMIEHAIEAVEAGTDDV